MAKREQPSEVQSASALLNIPEIRDLIDLLTEKQISEFEFERSGLRIRIVRGVPVSASTTSVTGTEQGSSSPHAAVEGSISSSTGAASSSRAFSQASSAVPSAAVEDKNIVRSPMVGTFYSAPTPDADPYVRVGDQVKRGQVLCVIEAMKLMNEIEAETSGVITKCHVENAQPVEFGEPLFSLRPL